MHQNNAPVDPKSSALLAHIVSQTQSNIDFLVSQNYIRASDAAGILSKLADITVNTQSAASGASSDTSTLVSSNEDVRNPVLSVADRMRQLSMAPSEPERAPSPPKAVMMPTRRIVPPPPPHVQQAKALWDYNADGSDPNDLSFRSGDIIEIVSETNADWWTGRLPNGRQGLFPSNYVEKLPQPPSSPMRSASPARSPVPAPALSFPGAGPGPYGPPTAPPTWQAPPQPYGYPIEKQNAVYGPPPSGPPQQYQAPPPPAGAPEPEKKKNKFGGLGNTMATSAAGGLGFGAGAAVGSGIINSIF
ncbi:hypothetical protein ACEPAI_6739 [Sanghuangporus weigelae]